MVPSGSRYTAQLADESRDCVYINIVAAEGELWPMARTVEENSFI